PYGRPAGGVASPLPHRRGPAPCPRKPDPPAPARRGLPAGRGGVRRPRLGGGAARPRPPPPVTGTNQLPGGPATPTSNLPAPLLVAVSSSLAPPGRRVPPPGAMRQESASAPASRMTEQNDRPEGPNREAHAPKIEGRCRHTTGTEPIRSGRGIATWRP